MNDDERGIFEYKDTISVLNNNIRLAVVSALSRHCSMTHKELLEELHLSLGIWRHLQDMVCNNIIEKKVISGKDVEYSLITVGLRSFAQALNSLCDNADEINKGEVN